MTKRSDPVPPPEALLRVLREHSRFVLGIHRGPDGDALGASLALFQALTAQGKSVQVVAPTIPGDHYLWLPGADHLHQQLEDDFEVALALDCDSLSRLDHLAEAFTNAPVLAQIDHHSGPPCGQVQYVDRHAAATCCLVWRLLQALEWPVTRDMATCLYTGLLTDTGCFRFENTNSEVFAIAAQLVALGADPFRIADLVSESRPVRRLHLAGRALASLHEEAGGRLVWGVLTPEDYHATGCNAADTESIVDLFKQAEHQEICVLFKTPRDPAKWQVSLRSRTVDVAAVAREFGGGGHARAAGFDYQGALAPLLEALLPRLQEALPTVGGQS